MRPRATVQPSFEGVGAEGDDRDERRERDGPRADEGQQRRTIAASIIATKKSGAPVFRLSG